jgi:hypothetical protein
VKLAETSAVTSVDSSHAPIPWQEPDQPTNAVPGAGIAVKRTLVLGGKSAVQVGPQSTPGGSDVMDPSPLPLLATTTLGPEGDAPVDGADPVGAADGATAAQ